MQKPNKKLSLTLGGIVSFLIIIAIGSGIALAMNVATSKMPIKKFFDQSQTVAVWDWNNIHNRDDKDLREISDFLYMHQVNTVYVDISSYSEVVMSNDAAFMSQKRQELENSIERYVNGMKRRNIRVLAAAGNTDWSKPELQKIPVGIQEFVFDYNRSHDAKLDGIEFDIESYNQSHFANASFTEKGLVLTEFLDLVDILASRQQEYITSTNENDFELGFAIPYWFDNQNQNIRSVDWKDKSGPALFHILDRLNTLPRTNVVVMAYRNAALGNDGSIFHSRTEIDYARSKAQNVDIIIGVEVNDIEPAKITYFGQTLTELSSEVDKMNKEFEDTSVYGGVAINDLQGYQLLSN